MGVKSTRSRTRGSSNRFNSSRGTGISRGIFRVIGYERYYFGSSNFDITIPAAEASYAKVIIIAGTGNAGGSGSSGGGGGGAGGQSNVRAYVNVPFLSLATPGTSTISVKADYTDPFYSSAIQLQSPSGGGGGGNLALSNANGTPYTSASQIVTALNSVGIAYTFGINGGGTSGSPGSESFGIPGGGGAGGRSGMVVTLNPVPSWPDLVLTPVPPPPTAVSGNSGGTGGTLFKDPGSYAFGGSGGSGGSGIGAGGGGGGGGGGTSWGDWGAGQSAGGAGGGSGASQRVFVAIKNSES
jgi:hypothetical protein